MIKSFLEKLQKKEVKILLFFIIGMVINLGISMFYHSSLLVVITIIVIIIFSLFLVQYYTLYSTDDDKEIILEILKSYYKIIFLLSTLFFALTAYLVDKELDFKKNEIEYSFKVNKTIYDSKWFIISQEYKDYKKSYESLLEIFSPVPIKYMISTENENNEKIEKPIIWFINLTCFLINLFTIFYILRCFNELSKFKIHINLNHIPRPVFNYNEYLEYIESKKVRYGDDRTYTLLDFVSEKKRKKDIKKGKNLYDLSSYNPVPNSVKEHFYFVFKTLDTLIKEYPNDKYLYSLINDESMQIERYSTDWYKKYGIESSIDIDVFKVKNIIKKDCISNFH
ncbi:hypothetical protein CP965_03690 [Halarcobacter mediterraneus]|uniref:Uncharacterized protein n=1 Tax=Halarcobacter mediterraneus TaxID=2023153 RepID=A0A4Q1B7I4_9BACT|nr:hypothetical protein [Halarcobacter mediterraneus]RXK14559.1 hypothetical protein CP965_03690 [Halarcobacter mediterraneus]